MRGITVLGLLVGACLSWPALAARQQLSGQGEIVRGPIDEKQLALVFTGHEFAEGGDAILSALSRRKARASFFLTGDFLRRPEFAPVVERIVAAGHYLGPHSDKHLLYCDWTGRKTLVTASAFRRDIEDNIREIQRFNGRRGRPRYFLPAYEWSNAEIVRWARDLGLTTVNMTAGTRSNTDYMEDADPKVVHSAAIVQSILAAEADDPHGLNGFILLMHIGAGPRRTDKLHARLPALLDTLAEKGYRFVTVEDLLRTGIRSQESGVRNPSHADSYVSPES